jgi:hypothetical protein
MTYFDSVFLLFRFCTSISAPTVFATYNIVAVQFRLKRKRKRYYYGSPGDAAYNASVRITEEALEVHYQ